MQRFPFFSYAVIELVLAGDRDNKCILVLATIYKVNLLEV